jgi:hypothetical protein
MALPFLQQKGLQGIKKGLYVFLMEYRVIQRI